MHACTTKLGRLNKVDNTTLVCFLPGKIIKPIRFGEGKSESLSVATCYRSEGTKNFDVTARRTIVSVRNLSHI